MTTPGLLVSVRSASEARVALREQVDVLDVKEPAAGSLGAASTDVIAAIIAEVAGQIPVSAALGELIELSNKPHVPLPHGVAFAKVGLAGCGQIADWPSRWQAWQQQLPTGTRAVAVAYADSQANAPSPWSIVEVAAQFSAAAVLLDTFDKSAGALLDHWPIVKIQRFVTTVQSAGMLCVVAGSLPLAIPPQLLHTRPDLFAVRGAICQGGRDGNLDGKRIRQFRQQLIRQNQRTPVV